MERRTFFKYSLNVGMLAGLSSSGISSPDTNSSTVNGVVSVKDFGATGNGSIQTAEIQKAINSSLLIYIPNGVYKVKDLLIKDKQNLIFESHDAIFEGETVEDNIFTSNSYLSRIMIYGGGFRNCTDVIHHSGDQSIANSEFKYMHIYNCKNGFNLSSSISNNWDSCFFGVDSLPGNIGTGILFNGTGSGQTNTNNIIGCSFLFFKTRAIHFSDTEIVKKKNIIDNCWFEDGNAGAIFIGGSSIGFTIQNNYFETNDSEAPDIHLYQNMGYAIFSIHIEKCEFSTPSEQQNERIMSEGNSAFSAVDNTVRLHNFQNFVRIESAAHTHTILKRNYISADTGGLYNERLFTKSSTQQVSWDVFVNSGFVSDDENPLDYFDGAKIQNVESFNISNTSPSVREGNFFKVAGSKSIQNFTQGRIGQKITILSEKQVLVKNSESLHLSNSLDFEMHTNDTLTLFMFNQNIWTEIARSINRKIKRTPYKYRFSPLKYQ